MRTFSLAILAAAIAGADPSGAPAAVADAGLVRPAGVIVPDPPASGFGFHGYLRSGIGVDQDGRSWERYLDSRVGRLGNEDTTYAELAFTTAFRSTDGGAWAEVGILLAAGPEGVQDLEEVDPAVREAYVELHGIAGEAVLWAGKRYYRRQDIGIMDFYYLDSSGPGAGIYGIPAGPARAAVMVGLHAERDAEVSAGGQTLTADGNPSAWLLDARLEGIPLADGHRLEAVLLVAGSAGADLLDPGGAPVAEAMPWSAFGASLRMVSDLPGGRNILAVQAGWGLPEIFAWSGLSGSSLIRVDGVPGADMDGSSVWRLLDDAVWRLAPRWELGLAAVHETVDRGGAGPRTGRTDLVVRPVLALGPRFSLAAEPGVSYIDDGAGDGLIAKATIAAQAHLDEGFSVRPVLRAFVTAAAWDEDLSPVGAYPDRDDGVVVGAQAEAWW